MKVNTPCGFCKNLFVSQRANYRKFCSKDCYFKSLLRVSTDPLKVTGSVRAKRFRINNRDRFLNSCVCGEKKYITSSKCRKCEDSSRVGEKSKFFKGGYENHLRLNRERVVKLKIIGNHTPEEWEFLKKSFNFMCLCCKKYEPIIQLTRDHIIPITKGGSDEIKNIQPLCRSCNSRKYTSVINFIELIKL